MPVPVAPSLKPASLGGYVWPSVITVTIVVVFIVMLATIVAFGPVVVTTMAAVVVIETRLIFRGSDEIHWPTTGIVFTAVLTPVARVLRWNMQVNRRWRGDARHRLNDEWLGGY